MRTLRTELRRAPAVLAVLACLAAPGLLPAEERDSPLRRQALKLNQVTGMDPLRGEVLALLEDKDAARKLVAEAARMAGEKPQPFSYNATLILATAASKLKDYGTAETFYRLHMDQAKHLLSVKGLTSAYGGLIEIAYENKNYAEAEKLCKEALALRPPAGAEEDDNSLEKFKSVVLEEMILAIAKQGDTDRAVDLIDRVLKGSPNSWLAVDLKARVYRIAEKNEQAAKLYEDALERIRKDTDLKQDSKDSLTDDIRYHLSGLYVDLNQIDKAADQLKALLEKEPDNPTYNNDLGFIWADHDMNLAESEKLIRKAIEEERKLRQKLKLPDDKDSAAYLDSLGWVLYKQKKYKEAKKYLQEAAEQEEGKHVEILDHLAEVHLALGEKAEALAAWKKGASVAGDSKREQKRKAEVVKKIKAHE